MPLVGDIIMSAREQIPDMPQVAVPPNIFSVTSAPGGSLDPTTWYVVLTCLTPWGESLPGLEVAETLTQANGTIAISWDMPGTLTDSASGIIGIRVYYGIQSGQQYQYTEYIGSNNSLDSIPNPIMLTAGLGIPGAPPAYSSAFLPDTAGKFINNYSMFRWLNEGLNILSKKTGGIQDATGVSTFIGQPIYKLLAKWIKIDHLWFDGWELIKGTRSDIFYRNAITAIANLTVTLRQSEASLLEVFPQPNRTAGLSELTAPMDNTTGSFSVNQTTNWVLPFGLAVLSQGSPWVQNLLPIPQVPFEIVTYSNIEPGGLFVGCWRGLGGSYPQTWPIGTQVSELNLRVSGFRMANNYQVGDSFKIANIPDGWCDILPIFMDSKALSVQGDKSGSSKRLQEFLKLATELAAASQPLQGPVQIGLASTNEVYNPGLGGGWYLQ